MLDQLKYASHACGKASAESRSHWAQTVEHRLHPGAKRVRSRGDLDEDEDAYLVPSDWEDEADDNDWGAGSAARRARDRLGKLSEVSSETAEDERGQA